MAGWMAHDGSGGAALNEHNAWRGIDCEDIKTNVEKNTKCLENMKAREGRGGGVDGDRDREEEKEEEEEEEEEEWEETS